MGKRRPVFVLSAGENGYGSSIVGVYGSIEAAQLAACKAWTEYAKTGLRLLGDPTTPTWKAEGDGKADIAWFNSCDYLEISRHEVE
jgi:hypothetical protein